jgi:hypothetical protein
VSDSVNRVSYFSSKIAIVPSIVNEDYYDGVVINLAQYSVEVDDFLQWARIGYPTTQTKAHYGIHLFILYQYTTRRHKVKPVV